MREAEIRDERAELLANVAERYYIRGQDQRAIALEIGTSRSNVSRLLGEARRRGIVEIRIHRPLPRVERIERDLRRRFDLVDARVAGDLQPASARPLEQVGGLAAEYLLEQMKDGLAIGMSWGTSLAAMTEALGTNRVYDAEVVQLLGGLSAVSPSLNGHELGRQLAHKLGGTFFYLHAPAIVESGEVRDSLLRQPAISDVLKKGAATDVAFVGIGSFGIGSSQALFAEARLAPAEKKAIKAAGAVGDVCARLFTVEGRPCETTVDHRVIGLELEDLRRIPLVVGVTVGIEKVKSTLGALRGGFVKVLVIDEATALGVLAADTD
jgi:DNA-binding transcriptional regulator LsrR (DeoR family)